ncbi:hypothetical protein DFA_00558 [Cavenderia fasciculata]|uniref:Transmembrane protein n=1 Tax=Cavenderia fasciculata TaxID=261658 RepID=F4PSK5_CACFS|nr:uncharacterized protein DFA_00558 [Cavenderia fasciculata]EGG20697.1 hypothetical protein DFA_00558 [Cavenderia fasciculata]|eukprot:XP_004358547.1 hypothetical protein DFA_00558 [Cavenderia fasciculata]
MFKIISSVLLVIFVSSILFSTVDAGITNVTQVDKSFVIEFTPNNMIWTAQQTRNKGMTTNIMSYCTQDGSSPMFCNLPSVPACDTIRLVGINGIGIGTTSMLFPFNCTVVA